MIMGQFIWGRFWKGDNGKVEPQYRSQGIRIEPVHNLNSEQVRLVITDHATNPVPQGNIELTKQQAIELCAIITNVFKS